MQLEDFELRPLRSHDRPRMGKLNLRTQHVDGQSGDWYFGSEIGSKAFGLTVVTLQRDMRKFNHLMDELLAFLLDEYGKPRLIKATIADTDRFIYLRLSDQVTPNVDSVLEKIPISFIAHDPHEYSSSNQYDLDTPLEYDAGHDYGAMAYPNTQRFDWIYTRHYSGLRNYATLNTDIKMTIKGTVKGGKVTHLESGQSVSFPDIVNGVVVIDTQTFNVEVNGVDTIFDGEFFALAPGDNGFLFEAEEVSASVEFEWWHKFN